MVIVNPGKKDVTINLEKTYRDVSTDMIGKIFTKSSKDSKILIKI